MNFHQMEMAKIDQNQQILDISVSKIKDPNTIDSLLIGIQIMSVSYFNVLPQILISMFYHKFCATSSRLDNTATILKSIRFAVN